MKRFEVVRGWEKTKMRFGGGDRPEGESLDLMVGDRGAIPLRTWGCQEAVLMCRCVRV